MYQIHRALDTSIILRASIKVDFQQFCCLNNTNAVNIMRRYLPLASLQGREFHQIMSPYLENLSTTKYSEAFELQNIFLQHCKRWYKEYTREFFKILVQNEETDLVNRLLLSQSNVPLNLQISAFCLSISEIKESVLDAIYTKLPLLDRFF